MLGADLPLAEQDRGFLPVGSPVWRLPVGLALFKNPESRLRQITSGSADGDGMPFAPTSARVEVDDVFAAPVGVVSMADDDVGGFNEGPLQVGVALLDDSGLGRRWR